MCVKWSQISENMNFMFMIVSEWNGLLSNDVVYWSCRMSVSLRPVLLNVVWDVFVYQYSLNILSTFSTSFLWETKNALWSTYVFQNRRFGGGHVRVYSCELSHRGHVRILYCHTQIKINKDEREILTFFSMSISSSENVKAFIWTAISSSGLLHFGICFWEQTVWGLPYVSPSDPSVFHLPVLTKRDRCTGVRTLGQAAGFLLAALSSYHMAYTSVY